MVENCILLLAAIMAEVHLCSAQAAPVGIVHKPCHSVTVSASCSETSALGGRLLANSLNPQRSCGLQISGVSHVCSARALLTEC